MGPRVQTVAQVRQSFLDFFRSKGHEIVPSSPVVLPADPTLLFANAGMNQFKEIFLGARTSAYGRVANTQKCIRVSGKHNDLEEVGLDTYHHTFFEMLGNWSFGDYYKREAIAWAWELLTGVWGLPGERLWATVYQQDDDAERLWREVTTIAPGHILRFGESDNFWEMGETGPCGPCSEIHFDRTPSGCQAALVNAGTPDVIEVWNLVFIQYNRRNDGSLEELPAKHVDTGMGLERITAVIQGRASNYDTDLFTPLIRRVETLSGRRYEGDAAVAMRVIADHLRTLAFAIADGALPSNEGRGYVLRRLLRRAVRYGRKIGMHQPFMASLLPVLEETLDAAYPELGRHRNGIGRALQAEEESFAATLDRGIELFEEVVEHMRTAGESVFPGDDAFRLYDTYGFPYDLTVLMAHERGLTVDRERFEERMGEQRERAREARRVAAGPGSADLIADLVARGVKSLFTGYDRLEEHTEALQVLRGAPVQCLEDGEEGAVVLARTPFYPEKGGQVGDRGVLRGPDGEFEVTDTQTPAEGIILHVGRVRRGRIVAGGSVTATVDADRRARTARHHTATHLLQKALRERVSPSIKQAGSLVSPERLRFDFGHYEALSAETLAAVERRVNELVLANYPVQTYTMALKDIQGTEIIALFDEKYGDRVRVVDVSGQSRELCGGTHVRATGEVGVFRILAESSIAAGVRRIEAVCGLPAYERMCRDRDVLGTLARRFSVAPDELPSRVDALADQVKTLEKEIARRDMAAAAARARGLVEQVRVVAGIRVVAAAVGEQSAEALKGMVDSVMEGLGSGVAVLGATADGKVQFIAAVSEDWIRRGLHAGRLVKEVAKVAGGGGGGQPALARAGARDPGKLGEAIARVPEMLAAQLKA